ncbi:2OG-Fe dioxygenase family protein [Neptunomonas qingdaonensis]|uniref:2OG-Fe dioxygenase n=1 Tax=Neptunomonas qingdaonensis TaxID=1045558 RepID=A0A1I2PER7_9GAMM|nr:2OG-Fe dioxygenase family protein [Neptunomonas qingdaonensis]SFG12146.1 hypothetical protein SAMN05216175_103313 [Neptunomonas qingdaonensis]
MKNTHIDYIRSSIQQPLLGKLPYWESHVKQDILEGSWSKTNIEEHINLAQWQPYLQNLPKDPYVDTRWKSMSWLYLDDSGHINTLHDCPMAQGGKYNDAKTMADKLRHYPALEEEFLQREDVQEFVKAWADLWKIQPKEPILMQINGVKGNQLLDPLQGQGIHQDGSHFLSILVINRQNVTGGSNSLYSDKAGHHQITETTLAPGEVIHIKDNEIFHNITRVEPLNNKIPFERFIIIINSRFNDPFQNKVLRQHFPEAVLNNG